MARPISRRLPSIRAQRGHHSTVEAISGPTSLRAFLLQIPAQCPRNDREHWLTPARVPPAKSQAWRAESGFCHQPATRQRSLTAPHGNCSGARLILRSMRAGTAFTIVPAILLLPLAIASALAAEEPQRQPAQRQSLLIEPRGVSRLSSAPSALRATSSPSAIISLPPNQVADTADQVGGEIGGIRRPCAQEIW